MSLFENANKSHDHSKSTIDGTKLIQELVEDRQALLTCLNVILGFAECGVRTRKQIATTISELHLMKNKTTVKE